LTTKKQLWYLDNGCSKYITREAYKFLTQILRHEGFVKYGDNNKERILGRGDVDDKDTMMIKDV